MQYSATITEEKTTW